MRIEHFTFDIYIAPYKRGKKELSYNSTVKAPQLSLQLNPQLHEVEQFRHWNDNKKNLNSSLELSVRTIKQNMNGMPKEGSSLQKGTNKIIQLMKLKM